MTTGRVYDRFPPPAVRPNELVYLLHGFGGKPVLMARVARHLQRHGFEVRNWSYPSVRKRVAFHTEQLRQEVVRVCAEEKYSRVHFVTHSLGGIVVRQLLCQELPVGFGRIVMVAPPNSGSHVARVSSMFLRGLCPVLGEISDRRSSFVNSLCEPADVEVGIIAGSGDWVVQQSSTHLTNERDHIILRAGHLRLPFLKQCAMQASYFLEHGAFVRGELKGRRLRLKIPAGRQLKIRR